jgi:hypothetical protein
VRIESARRQRDFHALLVETNAQLLDAPAEYQYQPGYYAYFSDPDGLKLEVVHIPII